MDDLVKRISYIRAGGLVVGTYTVYDPIWKTWSEPQIHCTHNGVVVATFQKSTVEFLSTVSEDTARLGSDWKVHVWEHNVPRKIRVVGVFTPKDPEDDRSEDSVRLLVYEMGVLRGIVGASSVKLMVSQLKHMDLVDA